MWTKNYSYVASEHSAVVVEDFFLEDHMVFRGNSRRQQGKRGDYRQLTDNYLPMTEDRKNIID